MIFLILFVAWLVASLCSVSAICNSFLADQTQRSQKPNVNCNFTTIIQINERQSTRREKERERRRAKGRRISNRKLSTRAFPNCCQHSVTNFLNINRLLSVLVTVAAPAAAAEGSSGSRESCHSSAECAKSSRN